MTVEGNRVVKVLIIHSGHFVISAVKKTAVTIDVSSYTNEKVALENLMVPPSEEISYILWIRKVQYKMWIS